MFSVLSIRLISELFVLSLLHKSDSSKLIFQIVVFRFVQIDSELVVLSQHLENTPILPAVICRRILLQGRERGGGAALETGMRHPFTHVFHRNRLPPGSEVRVDPQVATVRMALGPLFLSSVLAEARLTRLVLVRVGDPGAGSRMPLAARIAVHSRPAGKGS